MTSIDGARTGPDEGATDSAWQEELPQGASQSDRLRRIEEIARDYHAQVEAAADLGDQVASLAHTGASIDSSLNRLDASVTRSEQTRRYLHRVLVSVVVGTSVLVLAAVLGVGFLLQERLDARQFREGSLELCEQRDRQAAAIRLFAELEIERTRSSTLLNPEQQEGRVRVLETLSEDFPDEDCTVIE